MAQTMTKQCAGVTDTPARSERMTTAVIWGVALGAVLLAFQVVAYRRAISLTYSAGYWQGRADENELIVAIQNDEVEDNFGVALKIRNQIAASLGEAEAEHWVEHHLEFVPGIETGEWGDIQT